MRVGIISGSGSYTWPYVSRQRPREVRTEHGTVTVVEGRVQDTEVVCLSRHDEGHHRLSHQVAHKANLAALLECGVEALLSFTVCGTVDPSVEPGSLIVFDDLHFPANRLPDGKPCTWYDTPGEAGRGHWIFDGPFSGTLRRVLVEAAALTGAPVAERGTYGHVDGPRFNSRSEIRALAQAGVTAVSQTAGPEVVLAGERELPMALVGFVTDYANGVAAEPEPVEALLERMASSSGLFAALAEQALPALGSVTEAEAAGFVYRFGA